MATERTSGFRLLVNADGHRYGSDASTRALFRLYRDIPGFRYTFWMRLARHLQPRGGAWRPLYLFCRLMLRHQGVKYGLSIPYNTDVGPGLYIGHYGGVVVNDQAVIGRDCNINHGVTIGVAYGGRNPGVPKIGDRAYLGPGCVIIGGIRLGNDVAVGANAVVTESVPDSGVVAGVPARLISRKGSSAYVVNTTAPASDGIAP